MAGGFGLGKRPPKFPVDKQPKKTLRQKFQRLHKKKESKVGIEQSIEIGWPLKFEGNNGDTIHRYIKNKGLYSFTKYKDDWWGQKLEKITKTNKNVDSDIGFLTSSKKVVNCDIYQDNCIDGELYNVTPTSVDASPSNVSPGYESYFIISSSALQIKEATSSNTINSNNKYKLYGAKVKNNPSTVQHGAGAISFIDPTVSTYYTDTFQLEATDETKYIFLISNSHAPGTNSIDSNGQYIVGVTGLTTRRAICDECERVIRYNASAHFNVISSGSSIAILGLSQKEGGAGGNTTIVESFGAECNITNFGGGSSAKEGIINHIEINTPGAGQTKIWTVSTAQTQWATSEVEISESSKFRRDSTLTGYSTLPLFHRVKHGDSRISGVLASMSNTADFTVASEMVTNTSAVATTFNRSDREHPSNIFLSQSSDSISAYLCREFGVFFDRNKVYIRTKFDWPTSQTLNGFNFKNPTAARYCGETWVYDQLSPREVSDYKNTNYRVTVFYSNTGSIENISNKNTKIGKETNKIESMK